MADLDASCILHKQKDNLLFSYPVIYKIIEDAINENFRLNNDQYVTQTILSFLSTKKIHLIPSRSVNIDIDNNDEPLVELLAISVNNNQPLFTLSAKPRDLPLSWRQREQIDSGCESASYGVNISGKHIWIEYTEGDEAFSDDEAFENEDPNIYYEMQTHHLFHTQIVSANNVSSRVTRVSHRKKMDCPVKLGKWDIYSGKRELIKCDDNSDGYSLIKHTDLRNYKHQLFFIQEHCLLFANKFLYLLNTDQLNEAKWNKLTQYNQPEFKTRCASITNYFKSYNILDVAFLLNNIENYALSKSDKIMSILYNTSSQNFKIDFILIPAKKDINNYGGPPPVKKRKVENENENESKSLLFSMNLNGLLSRLYDINSLFIHGYFIDIQNEWLLIVVNTIDILCIDKECNLIKRHRLNDNVFDKKYFQQWWTPNDYIVKIEKTLNNRDFLFIIHSASNSGMYDVVIVDGYNFSRIENGRFESHLRWGRGLSDFGSNCESRTPCDLSNLSNLFPFIY